MESVIVDEGGTWYGYYHNEVPASLCDRLDRVLPRIGAARSRDSGETWEDLGIILEAPPGWHDCATTNQYFVGGVGDVSVLLDRESKDLYLYFSQYSTLRGRAGRGAGAADLGRSRRAGRQGDGASTTAPGCRQRASSSEDDDGNTRDELDLPVRHAARAADAPVARRRPARATPSGAPRSTGTCRCSST